MSFRRFQHRPPHRQQGYMILLACFLVALVVISMAAVMPDIVAQIRRDKEVEMIHRGVQYTRAIQKYNTKTNGYPTSIDQLLVTNHIRFLRQRYKDPMTGKDFRLLRQTDPQVVAALASVGGLAGMGAAGNAAALLGGLQNNSSIPGAQNISDMANPSPSPSPEQAGQPSASGSPSPSDSSSSGTSGGSAFGGQTFGGGPFVGVASSSKKKGFHIFNKKDHYNDWLFIYMTTLYSNYPAGYLIKTPFNGVLNLVQSTIPGATPIGGQPATTPAPTPNSGYNNNFGSGNQNSFGGGQNMPPVPSQ
jgi:hypothetical protein